MPAKYLKILRERLRKYKKFHSENFKNLDQVDLAFGPKRVNSFDKYEVKNAFFELIANILKDYTRFLVLDNKKKELRFDEKAFLRMKKVTGKEEFLYKFTKTMMFTYWLEIKNNQNSSSPDILLFERASKIKKTLKNTHFIK